MVNIDWGFDMDQLVKALSAKTKIRFTTVDVTMAAKALEARHLCGPTSGMALAEGLVAVALLAMDAASDEEALMLRVNSNGPLGGMMVEARGDGGLRGFTNTKILNDLDVLETIATDDAWGSSGAIQILKSVPGKILSKAALNVNPPKMKFVLARYFNHSMQIPTACEIWVKADSGGLIQARGILAQRMEDSDMDAFVRVLEAFDGDAVREKLMQTSDCLEFKDVFGIDDIEAGETRKLMFKCTCTKERVLAALKNFSKEELEQIRDSEKPQNITCHMCGDSYSAMPDDVQAIIDEMGAKG